MEQRKVFWGISGIIALGFVIFNNFDSTLNLIKQDNLRLLSLIISLIISTVYGIHNREKVFK